MSIVHGMCYMGMLASDIVLLSRYRPLANVIQAETIRACKRGKNCKLQIICISVLQRNQRQTLEASNPTICYYVQGLCMHRCTNEIKEAETEVCPSNLDETRLPRSGTMRVNTATIYTKRHKVTQTCRTQMFDTHEFT